MDLLFWLLLFLLLLIAATSFLTYSFFWFENGARLRYATESAARLRSMVVSGFLSALASLIVLGITYPFGFVEKLWKVRDLSPSQPVIVLVHGLYHNAAAWLLFRYRLRKAGFKNIFVMNYTSFNTSFEAVLGKLHSFVCGGPSSRS